MTSLIIGLHSPQPESGKSTIAKALTSKGFHVILLSQPLLNACFASMTEVLPDHTPGQIWHIIHNEKDTPRPEFYDFSPREFMHDLAKVWRAKAGDYVLADIANRKIVRLQERDENVVVDGLRTPYEADFLQKRGGILATITRPGNDASTKFDSNTLADWPFDYHVANDGTIEQLQPAALGLLAPPRERGKLQLIRASALAA